MSVLLVSGVPVPLRCFRSGYSRHHVPAECFARHYPALFWMLAHKHPALALGCSRRTLARQYCATHGIDLCNAPNPLRLRRALEHAELRGLVVRGRGPKGYTTWALTGLRT